ncbi:DNA-binding transcriptional regulator, IclR family [Raineyella antarctica]|uniref:DNA-binding transcriptional regulator, IclR family n=1 Tax=Raineyella antarctica TaxID=1577474 RepID=A0A1G6GCV5_9ACTN|nr:IclR family transcriptional regulator [Raineyella antarctica]SDB79800.1 DNA-binding transcriptional regulator, IclR family [Raineyella antarctica]
MANSPSGESVISRVVRILESFDRQRSQLSQSALARRADLPLSTAQRLTVDLVKAGLLERTPSGDLRPGLRLWELALRSSRALSLREIALPFMTDVLTAVKQHTTLAVLDGGTVLYVERMSASESGLDQAHIAQRMPIHACSSGIALMAHQPPDVQETFLAGPLAALTPFTPTDAAALRRLFAEVRSRGFVAPAGIGVTTWTGIAVPVWGPTGVIAALNAIVPTEGSDVSRIVPALVTAAHGIGRVLRDEIGDSALSTSLLLG